MAQDQTAHFRKRALRRSIRQRILGLDSPIRAVEESDLAARFLELPGYAAAHTILLYMTSFPEEIDTRPFFLHAITAGKRVLFPRVDRQVNRMRLYQVSSLDAHLEPGILGIPEPRASCVEVDVANVDWALIPGLAFDSRCYRLGRGGGHYDRLLPMLRPDTPCWALSLSCQIERELPLEPHDVPISGVATPRGFIDRT